ATADWRDGVAMQAVDLTGDQGLPALALELVLDSDGLEFSATGEAEAVGDFGLLAALLPADPVSHIAMALEPETLADAFAESELERCAAHGLLGKSGKPDPKKPEKARCGLIADDKLPPLVLAESAQALALGWYPTPGDALWQPWVLLMPVDAKLRKAATAAGIELPKPGEQKQAHGLHWQIRDGVLAVASTEALAMAVRDRPTPPAAAPGAPAPFVSAGLNGPRAAEVVRTMAKRYEGDHRADYLRLLATMIGLVESVELSGAWTEGAGKGGRLRAGVRLHLAESEEELALLDRWLASPEVGNASRLPRRLGSADTARGLVYRIAVADAEHFARTAIPDDNPRMRVEVVAPDELRLTVLPSSALGAGGKAPLSAEERERMLADDSLIRSEAPAIVEVAGRLKVAGDDPATVAAVVSWVHEHVKYEITPNSPDALTVLERGQGDCTEYALLTVTILRAAGIPARLQEGMAAGGDEMVAHAWVAWHDGQRWHEVDPTAGTDSVGSGHLELEVVDVLAMISLGRFEVVAIDPLG
ncbi:MAG: transglutaminase domain-containing protein, partial [Myxococcales bacterium]|nr:transglutaminase domain-containing protein [Myxococcales bacterium]